MATGGALADFGRLPPQRKAMVFIIIGAVLGLLYFQFVFKPLKSKVTAAENENKAKASQNSRLTGDIKAYEELKPNYEKLTREVKDALKTLPSEAEVPALFETLERKFTEAGVTIVKFKRAKDEAIESFVRVPVDVEIIGSYMQIKRFFASLVTRNLNADGKEEPERIITIDNLQLVSPYVQNREIVMTAKFTASTYRQDEVPAVPTAAPAAPAKAAAPAPAAPAAPAAAPPPPSAATPAGAKARTESAIDKGDATNRNAAGVEEAKTPGGAGSARLKGGI